MRNCEVVIASDVVYDPICYSPLKDSLKELLQVRPDGSKPICILAHRHRHPEDALFFKMLDEVEGMVIEKILYDTKKDVHIFKIYKE